LIDGAGDTVVATVPVGKYPCALYYNSLNNKIYAANHDDSSVSVIDGSTNNVTRTIALAREPVAIAWNPAQNRIYVANRLGNSISVLRDSMTGIEEYIPQAIPRSLGLLPTVVRGVLLIPASSLERFSQYVLLDASGHKVKQLRPGSNDVSEFASGVYFVRVDSPSGTLARKVVLTE
jgi:YVTN family beta-propeller protein